MDWKQAWPKTVNATNWTVGGLASMCGPFAVRWDAEAARRRELRTPETRKAHSAARANVSRAAAKVQKATGKVAALNGIPAEKRSDDWKYKMASETAKVRAARVDLSEARTVRKEARKAYPLRMWESAGRLHAVHAAPAAFFSEQAISAHDLLGAWPGAGSLALIAANVLAVKLGRRAVQAPVEEVAGMNALEQRLAARLDPSWWVENAPKRKLAGTVPTPAELTDRGLVSHVRLDDTWTPDSFKAAADQILALLGAPSDLRMEIKAGSHRDRALIVLRTRAVKVPESLIWTPESVGVGIDLETGEPVVIPIEGTHKGVAAATNMGKSTFWRPWMMEAVANPLMAGVLLDPKRQEARQWKGKIRTEGHQKDGDIRQYIYDGVCELEREMRHRQSIAEVTQWVPTKKYPILLVVIEEMANIVRMAKERAWKDVLDKLDGLFSEARASGIWFVWATQFPSRSGGGITPQIAENTLTMVALTTEGSTADQVIYGNDGPGKGWKPSELGGIPGRALIKHKKRPPNPVQAYYVTDETIRALPDVDVWHHGGGNGAQEVAAVDGGRPVLRLVKDLPSEAPTLELPAQAGAPEVPAEPRSNRDRVLQAVRDGARTPRDVVDRTEINKGTVSREIKGLLATGGLRKTDDGLIVLGEVSA